MSDRFIVNTSSGEAGVRTNSRREAEEFASRWGTVVIDTEAER